MTHKANCRNFCIEALKQKSLEHYFNEPDFLHIYRKFKGANSNAYLIGLGVADFIIFNVKYHPEKK